MNKIIIAGANSARDIYTAYIGELAAARPGTEVIEIAETQASEASRKICETISSCSPNDKAIVVISSGGHQTYTSSAAKEIAQLLRSSNVKLPKIIMGSAQLPQQHEEYFHEPKLLTNPSVLHECTYNEVIRDPMTAIDPMSIYPRADDTRFADWLDAAINL